MTYETATATLIAPLEALTGQSCPLERVAVLVGNKEGQEKYLEAMVKPNSLTAVIKAKRILSPGNWFIIETLTGDQLPKLIDTDGDAWFEF